jgi:hypothetical protein
VPGTSRYRVPDQAGLAPDGRSPAPVPAPFSSRCARAVPQPLCPRRSPAAVPAPFPSRCARAVPQSLCPRRSPVAVPAPFPSRSYSPSSPARNLRMAWLTASGWASAHTRRDGRVPQADLAVDHHQLPVRSGQRSAQRQEAALGHVGQCGAFTTEVAEQREQVGRRIPVGERSGRPGAAVAPLVPGDHPVLRRQRGDLPVEHRVTQQEAAAEHRGRALAVRVGVADLDPVRCGCWHSPEASAPRHRPREATSWRSAVLLWPQHLAAVPSATNQKAPRDPADVRAVGVEATARLSARFIRVGSTDIAVSGRQRKDWRCRARPFSSMPPQVPS